MAPTTGIAKFVKSRPTLFTVLGAAVVFVTYVVKDGLREKMKDDVTELSNLRAEYRERSEHDEEMTAIRNIGTERQAPANSDSALRPTPMSQSQTRQAVEGVLDSDDLTAYLHESDILWSGVHDDEEVKRAANNAQNRASEVRLLRNEVDQLFQSDIQDSGNMVSTLDQQDFLAKAQEKQEAARKAAFVYSMMVFTRAVGKQAREQRRYEQFTKWSYGLFTMGWLLGLLGKLFEPNHSDEPEALVPR